MRGSATKDCNNITDGNNYLAHLYRILLVPSNIAHVYTYKLVFNYAIK